MSYSYYKTYQLHQFDMTFSYKNECHLSDKHVSSMFVFSVMVLGFASGFLY